MAFSINIHRLPRDNEQLSSLHEEVAMAFEYGLPRYGDSTAFMFGDKAAHAAMRAVLFESEPQVFHTAKDLQAFEEGGWKSFLAENPVPDAVEMTQLWRDGAEYAGQGLVPHERTFVSLKDREVRVRTLVNQGKTAIVYGSLIVGAEFDFIWHGVAARAAIDFGDARVTLDGLQLLSNLSIAVIRNAVNIGDICVDENGTVSAEEATAWLARRREFCPSRWRDPHDNQWPFDPDNVIAPDGSGMVWVPQAADDDRFMPERVARSARGASTRSASRSELRVQNDRSADFYEALQALAKMDVARWRRPNTAGNWGIVRARGAWVAVEKAEIDRQLVAKVAEVSP